jgi:Arc/MetJ-type ribon-helix-helix transcriptional regulator
MSSFNEETMRVKKTVTLPKDVVEWLESQIRERRFRDISHGLEYAVYQLMKKEKETH